MRHQAKPHTKLSAPSEEAIAHELAAMLTYYDQDRDSRPAGPFTVRTFDEACVTMLEPLWKMRLNQVREDPIRTVLKGRACEIGWMLHSAGGIELLERVCDRVDELTPGRPGGAVLDKWWDGIGFWNHGGVWCA